MANIPTVIYVTYVEKENAYVKIWGQTDRNISIGIEKALQLITPQFESGDCIPHLETLQIGALCCAKFKDGSYYRARIINTNYFARGGLIEVLFIDYGNRDYVHYSTIRTMSVLSPALSSIHPQAKDYILANITHPSQTWSDQNFELISSEIRYLEFHLLILMQIGPYALIKLLRNNEDVALSLVSRGLAVTVSTQMQAIGLQNYMHQPSTIVAAPNQTSPQQQMQNNTPTILAYKTIPLEPGSEHAVFVSYVTDGPCLFSVQLKKMEDLLKKLMTEINSITLMPLEENPLPGTVCLAKSLEDGYICRAVVTNMVDEQFKVIVMRWSIVIIIINHIALYL